MVSNNGTIGTNVAAASRTMASLVIGAICIVRTTSKLLPRSARLDVPATYKRLIGWRAAAQPLGIELAHVTLGQRAILAIARPLRLSKLRRQHQKRAKHHA
jgi:hypothetical protein